MGIRRDISFKWGIVAGAFGLVSMAVRISDLDHKPDILMGLVCALAALSIVVVALNREDANIDFGTLLPNRRNFLDSLMELIKAGQEVTLVFADLNGLHDINTELGHDGGNLVLRWFGDTARRLVRFGDVVARYAGDEFAIVLPKATLSAGVEMGERLVKEARTKLAVKGQDLWVWEELEDKRRGEPGEAGVPVKIVQVGTTIGVASLPAGKKLGTRQAREAARQLVALASARMLHGKSLGKNVVVSAGAGIAE